LPRSSGRFIRLWRIYPPLEDRTGAVQQFFTARCAQDAKHAKKDIVTAGYRRSQKFALIFSARQGMVLCLIVRPDHAKN